MAVKTSLPLRIFVWLRTDRVFGEHGIRQDAEDFVARMLDRVEGACGRSHTCRDQAESMEQRAE